MVSVSKKYWVVLLVILSLVLVACERPFSSNTNVPAAPDNSGEVTDPNATGSEGSIGEAGETTEGGETTTGETGTGEGQEGTTETGETGDTQTGETGGEGETTTEDTSGEVTTGETTSGETSGEGETIGEGGSEETTDPQTTEEQSGEDASQTADNTSQEQTTTPAVHVVVRGDTLYKIGLQYGVSWARLAEFNNITNPHRLTVGQEIKIPGADEPTDPTPSPQTDDVYVVKAGDNLYRIGLAHGVSWVQIAEANGIMNPNFLVVGQQIKIPTSAEGPSPEFTHQVRRGQTLFSISLQYGVPWADIAEANDIESPYVIFPGQMLIIPSE